LVLLPVIGFRLVAFCPAPSGHDDVIALFRLARDWVGEES